MTIARLQSHPGLTSGSGFTEVAYDTGHEEAALSTARVRITPEIAADAPRLYQPNAPVLPSQVVVVMSASLIDAAGQVLTIGGRLLLGAESRHSRQFDAAAPFDPVAWLDGCAATMIEQLLRLAEGLAAADAAGLLPPLPEGPGGE
jgi:hypothetical protein